MLRESLKNITIERLLATNQISVRTANCCHNAEFDSLYDIISYYEQGNSFSTIRNAGKLTCEELKSLYYIYLSNLSDIDLQIVENKDLKIERKPEGELLYESLSTNQCLLIEQKYSELISHYSVRTRNGLRKITANEFIESYLFCDSRELIKLKNIGKKSISEIIEFRLELKSFIEKIKYIDNSPLACIKLKTVNKYGDCCDNDFIINFYEEHSHLPMFWILEQLLIKSNNRSIEILIDSFPIFKNYQVQTLDEIAAKKNLTRERIRQIRNDIFYYTFEITNEVIEHKQDSDLLKYIKLLANRADWKYLLDFLQETEVINQESFEIRELLKIEHCNLSALFVLQIIANIFRDKYSLLGGLCLSNHSRNSTFIISKEFTEIFDFEKFIQEFTNHITENETEYDLNVEDFLSNSGCWTSVIDLDKYNDVVSIVKDILLYEFHLYSNLDGLITIPATKGRRPLDIVYEILKKNENPMHLGDIFVEFKKILPEHKYTEAAQLRPWLQRHEAISYINRKSVYTLKEWDHIKSGTIRDAIIEFLMKKDSPQTTDDITEYVLQYFPKTNIASVRTTMFNDTQKRFLYFNDGLFGLVSKTYPDNYEEIKQQEGQRKAFEQRLYDLEKFLSENDHFPFATSDNEEESSLYRWWKIQNRDAKSSERQKAEIDRIKSQYADFDTEKTIYEWFFHFNDFKLFVLENRRLPSSSGSEKFLYGWFRRTKDDFLNERLNEKQRTKYAELFKEIKYVER